MLPRNGVLGVRLALLNSSFSPSSRIEVQTYSLCRVNTNTQRLCSWILAYILHDPELHSLIEQEILPITATNPPVASLSAAFSECQQHSQRMYPEVLRLVNRPISLRHVTHPARTASQKLLHPGAQVMMAPTLLGHLRRLHRPLAS